MLVKNVHSVCDGEVPSAEGDRGLPRRTARRDHRRRHALLRRQGLPAHLDGRHHRRGRALGGRDLRSLRGQEGAVRRGRRSRARQPAERTRRLQCRPGAALPGRGDGRRSSTGISREQFSGVIVQLWAEAAVDPEIRDLVAGVLVRVRETVRRRGWPHGPQQRPAASTAIPTSGRRGSRRSCSGSDPGSWCSARSTRGSTRPRTSRRFPRCSRTDLTNPAEWAIFAARGAVGAQRSPTRRGCAAQVVRCPATRACSPRRAGSSRGSRAATRPPRRR